MWTPLSGGGVARSTERSCFVLLKMDLTISSSSCSLFIVSSTLFIRDTDPDRHPLLQLADEDLDLVVRFVVQSGSLKDLATEYDVSYPTIRARLDRVIDRLKRILAGRKPDPLSELLADMVERGELSTGGALTIREAARRAARQSNSGGAP